MTHRRWNRLQHNDEWLEKVLHSFGGGSATERALCGPDPRERHVLRHDLLWWLRGHGGSGSGVVYSVTTSGAEKVLHSFGNGRDGKNPRAALIDVNGTLYGTTLAAALSVVEPSTDQRDRQRRVQQLQALSRRKQSLCALINVNGTLYGTTENGGTLNGGTVFTITRRAARQCCTASPGPKELTVYIPRRA